MNLLEKKLEAVKRLKMLELYPTVVKDFEKSGKIYLSESDGILFCLSEDEKEMVKKWEQEQNSLVYHVVKTNTNFGLLYSLLYVSDTEDEWEMESDDVNELTPFVYVVNKTEPMFSEFGSITIMTKNGGLVRVF